MTTVIYLNDLNGRFSEVPTIEYTVPLQFYYILGDIVAAHPCVDGLDEALERAAISIGCFETQRTVYIAETELIPATLKKVENYLLERRRNLLHKLSQ